MLSRDTLAEWLRRQTRILDICFIRERRFKPCRCRFLLACLGLFFCILLPGVFSVLGGGGERNRSGDNTTFCYDGGCWISRQREAQSTTLSEESKSTQYHE